MKTYKFRPNSDKMTYRIRVQHYGDNPGYRNNYQVRSDRVWDGRRKFLCRLFSWIHSNHSHAPKPVARRWQQANRRFERRFGNSDRASRRFINEHTAHAWA